MDGFSSREKRSVHAAMFSDFSLFRKKGEPGDTHESDLGEKRTIVEVVSDKVAHTTVRDRDGNVISSIGAISRV